MAERILRLPNILERFILYFDDSRKSEPQKKAEKVTDTIHRIYEEHKRKLSEDLKLSPNDQFYQIHSAMKNSFLSDISEYIVLTSREVNVLVRTEFQKQALFLGDSYERSLKEDDRQKAILASRVAGLINRHLHGENILPSAINK